MMQSKYVIYSPSGNYLKELLLHVHPRALLQGAGTNERCLIEILASRNNKQIQDMVEAYKDGKT